MSYPTITPTPIVFYVRAVPRARAWHGLRDHLRGANILIIESAHLGESGFLKVSVTPTPTLPTYAAIEAMLTEAGGWDAYAIEPKHSLFLFAKEENSEGARSALERWAAEHPDLEVTLTDHPGVEGMVRADVIGTLSEKTVRAFTWDFLVWVIDAPEVREARGQAEPAMHATCDGCGCSVCGQMGIIPAPIGGYLGAGLP